MCGRDVPSNSSVPPLGANSEQTICPRLAVLVSGGGRSLENLAQRISAGRLRALIACVICSNPAAGAVERCRRLNIPCTVLRPRDFPDQAAFGNAVFSHVEAAKVDLVCLAGFLSFLPVPQRWLGRVLNIHPALLPAFGGKGMYGHHVHEAVLAAGAAESGCTVHLVDNEYDHGAVLVQRRCPVLPGDSPDRLADRVFALECEAYPEAISLLSRTLAGARP